MNKFKRLMALMLAVVMTVTMLAACGDKVEEPPVDNPNVTDQQVPDVTPATDPTVDTDPTVTSAPDTEPTVSDTQPTEPSEVVTTTEPTQKPDTTTEDDGSYTVEEMSATMYATDSVNVRSGPGADYDKIGRFSKNDAVTVTGRASTGWFRVVIDGKTGFVSNAYLTDKKPSGSTSTQKPTGGDEPDIDLGDDDTNPLATFEGFGDVIEDNGLEYIMSRINDSKYETVIRQILEGIQNFMPVIYVDPLISADEAQEFQDQILPIIAVEYCYVEGIRGSMSGGYLNKVTVNYYCEYPEDGVAMVNKLRSKTDSVLSKVKSSWSDYQKVKYIHDWLVLNSTPDSDNIGGPWASNAYGAIVDGRPTCLGYAKATFYMLSRLGFDTVFDIGMGTTAKHIWVKVKVDGDWYCLDTTWDDPVSPTKTDPDYISYTYFLRTDEFMTNTHADNFDMIFFNEPSATATRLSWYDANGYCIESMSDAESVLKKAIKDAVADGDKYEYVSVYCSSVDIYDQIVSKYASNGGFKKLLANETSKYKLDETFGGTKKGYPAIHTKTVTFRIKK